MTHARYFKLTLTSDIEDAIRAKTITQQEADAFMEQLKATDWKRDDADAPFLARISEGVEKVLQEFAEQDDPDRWRFSRRDHIE